MPRHPGGRRRERKRQGRLGEGWAGRGGQRGMGWPGRLRSSFRSAALHAHRLARASAGTPRPDPVLQPRSRSSPSPSRPARRLLLAQQRKWTLRLTDPRLPFFHFAFKNRERYNILLLCLVLIVLSPEPHCVFITLPEKKKEKRTHTIKNNNK